MTLQQLEYILALDRLGNFAKAADYCDVNAAHIKFYDTEIRGRARA